MIPIRYTDIDLSTDRHEMPGKNNRMYLERDWPPHIKLAPELTPFTRQHTDYKYHTYDWYRCSLYQPPIHSKNVLTGE